MFRHVVLTLVENYIHINIQKDVPHISPEMGVPLVVIYVSYSFYQNIVRYAIQLNYLDNIVSLTLSIIA
jgi:hypothetical protein